MCMFGAYRRTKSVWFSTRACLFCAQATCATQYTHTHVFLVHVQALFVLCTGNVYCSAHTNVCVWCTYRHSTCIAQHVRMFGVCAGTTIRHTWDPSSSECDTPYTPPPPFSLSSGSLDPSLTPTSASQFSNSMPYSSDSHSSR